eukprot:scaffold1163_cov362-Prasinococcus_capsulatus_cf.AAC.9
MHAPLVASHSPNAAPIADKLDSEPIDGHQADAGVRASGDRSAAAEQSLILPRDGEVDGQVAVGVDEHCAPVLLRHVALEGAVAHSDLTPYEQRPATPRCR